MGRHLGWVGAVVAALVVAGAGAPTRTPGGIGGDGFSLVLHIVSPGPPTFAQVDLSRADAQGPDASCFIGGRDATCVFTFPVGAVIELRVTTPAAAYLGADVVTPPRDATVRMTRPRTVEVLVEPELWRHLAEHAADGRMWIARAAVAFSANEQRLARTA